MNNGELPTHQDLALLVSEVGGIKLESAEPALLEGEQWISLPDSTMGFVCARAASSVTVEQLQTILSHQIASGQASPNADDTQKQLAAHTDLERLAMLDPLTELPNRRKLFDSLDAILDSKQSSAILQIDLDRFKIINDTLGHAAGDEVLMVVAKRLSGKVRPCDLVARIGGDEFVIACPDVSDTESVGELAERLIESLNQPMRLEGHQYQLGASIGIAFKELNDKIDPDTLLQNADLALYTSKEKGRNQFHVYDPLMRNKFDAAQSMKKELGEACENGSIVAHFQPMFCMQSGLVSGIQAMARWRHSSLGLLPYRAFEQHADEKSLSNIDKVMLDQCLVGIKKLSDHEADVSRFSITASMKRMRDSEFVAHLQAETKKHGLSPKQVSLEILEDETDIGENEALLANIAEVREAGYGISLSNFGGNNSNLQALIWIRPHSIKLDGSLCRNLADDTAKKMLISGIINMAEHLNSAVIATVVETESDRDILAKLGCNFIQGNIMYPPSDIDSLANWLNTGSTTKIKAA